jgi:hypothetical protein
MTQKLAADLIDRNPEIRRDAFAEARRLLSKVEDKDALCNAIGFENEEHFRRSYRNMQATFRMRAYKERVRAQGFASAKILVHPADREALRDFAAKLNRARGIGA